MKPCECPSHTTASSCMGPKEGYACRHKDKTLPEKAESYLTEAEIVTEIVAKVRADDPANLKQWQDAPKQDLIMLHHSLGMHIRNYFRLWEPENPHTVIDPPPNARGIIDHPDFPDQMSQRIIEKVWQELRP